MLLIWVVVGMQSELTIETRVDCVKNCGCMDLICN
jgi:hypothetical protein